MDEDKSKEQSHIGVEREPDLQPQRRRRRAHPPPKPVRTRSAHGAALERSVDAAVASVDAARQSAGIATDRMLVVEFRSWDSGCRNVFEERFGASVVDERLVRDESGTGLTQVLVQFPSGQHVARLRAQTEEYLRDSEHTSDLPPGLRRDFFDGLETVRALSRADRLGARLREHGFPDTDLFYIDVDLWHPGTSSGAREILEHLRRLCTDRGGRVTEDLRTSSLVLARVQATRVLAETLLGLDIVAQVNLPPVLPAVYDSLFDPTEPLPEHTTPTGSEPIVVVVDSGVLPGHPLLRGWVVDERDFDSGESTAHDRHGHGTQVAGLALYGDVAECLKARAWSPRVMIASAKVLRRDSQGSSAALFPEEHRPEALVERAIRHFHEERGCRVFNLSLGNRDDVYAGGRQFAWAEVLDQLARELGIVIVVAAGNNATPPMPQGVTTRAEFQACVRDALLTDPSARLCNPATSAIAITVGSVARSARPRSRDAFAGAPVGAPAPFSRVGPGYESKPTQRAIKPEFVAFGGNYAVRARAGQQATWVEQDIYLGEPTTRLNLDGGRPLGAVSGTSFAVPHVSHAAAWALEAVNRSLGSMDANAARALLGVCSATPPCGREWVLDPEGKEGWERLRLVGYGMVDVKRVHGSLANDACLVATDVVDEDHWHVYRIPVPAGFGEGRGRRGVAVALAFDPPVRASRREYLARTMWVEVLKGLSIDDVRRFRSRHTGMGTAPRLPQANQLEMRPTKTDVQWSTLQVRRKEWTRFRGLPVVAGSTEAALHIVVGCQSRFAHGEGPGQGYGLAIRFWHEDASVQIYQQLKARVRPRVRVRQRVSG